ncbi:MAG: hypothetical protein NVSMB48_13180 [Marmoricola sp.]
MRVLVVADIRLYREGVAGALRALADVETAATASNGPAAVIAARSSECNVAIIDTTLPDSRETIAALFAARPALKVVALGVREEGPDVVACAEAGVHGYVSRDASLNDLADALRAARRGEAICSAKIAAGLLRHIAEKARASQRNTPIGLTSREQEILRLVEQGMSNRQIGQVLDLQLSTVKNHVHNVLTKLGATTRTDVSAALARVDLDLEQQADLATAPGI